MQDFQNYLKYYQNVENWTIFSHVTLKIGCSDDFQKWKVTLKILNSFQHFGNILTDSECPAFKFFRTGLTCAFILTEKFKNQQNVDDFFLPKTVFWKNSSGEGLELIVLNPYLDSLCNSAFQNIGLTWSQRDVFNTLRMQWCTQIEEKSCKAI